MMSKNAKCRIMDLPSQDDKVMYTTQNFYQNISNIEEVRDEINKECDELVEQFKDDIMIAQIIHRAILDATELKDDGKTQWCINDVIPQIRHRIVFALAKRLKEALAQNANQCRTIHELNNALQNTRGIIIKHWQSYPEK